MRVLVLFLMTMVAASGCVDGDEEPIASEAYPIHAHEFAVEGRYESYGVADLLEFERGERLSITLGETWKWVEVTLDMYIMADLLLLPPGCEDAAADCAHRFAPADGEAGGSWTLPEMEPGTWGIAFDRQGYLAAGSVYELTFRYWA